MKGLEPALLHFCWPLLCFESLANHFISLDLPSTLRNINFRDICFKLSQYRAIRALTWCRRCRVSVTLVCTSMHAEKNSCNHQLKINGWMDKWVSEHREAACRGAGAQDPVSESEILAEKHVLEARVVGSSR